MEICIDHKFHNEHERQNLYEPNKIFLLKSQFFKWKLPYF